MSFAALSRWRRSSSARFALLFLILFGVTGTGLFAFVYFRAIAHFNAQTDEWLTRETVRLAPATPRGEVIARVARHNQNDYNHLRPFGLFDAAGRLIDGGPHGLPSAHPDGAPFEMTARTERGTVKLRAMTRRLANGDRFLAAQDLQETRAFARELVLAIIWGGVGLLALGLAGTILLALWQETRVRRLTQSLHEIMAGRLDARLAPSPRQDELDDLSGEVNRMIDELQRLMLEVKTAGDAIAHDMRTPLTRLLANLRRVDTDDAAAPDMASVIADSIDEVTGMIGLFNALLRLSEIEETARREGFRALDLARIVADATDYHEVAAIERDITIQRELSPIPPFEGDADLLFEAIGNLVDNAIKYTPPGGRILVRLADGPTLTVTDNGPGIPAGDHAKVVARFHRVEASRNLPGNGLGLALVAAIARIHALDLRFGDAGPGCIATLARPRLLH